MKNSSIKRHSNTPIDLEVFFDSECPLCRREIEFIQKKAKSNSIRFVDIPSLSESQIAETGRSVDQLMKEIHARIIHPEVGDWITGPEVFRQIYNRLGWRSAVGFSRWPLISHTLQLAYRVFAKLRYRSAMKRWQKAQNQGCSTNTCSQPPSSPSP